MSELMPERRTDKNGVTSTKWVKPGQHIPQNTKVMPPLPGAKEKGLPFKKGQLRNAINLGDMKDNKNVKHLLMKQVNMLSEAGVDLALKTLEKHQGPKVNSAVWACIDSWTRDKGRTEEGLILFLKFAAVESVYDDYLKTTLFGSRYKAQEIIFGTKASLSRRDDKYLNDDFRQLNDDELNEALMAGYVSAIVETHLSDFNKDRPVTPEYAFVFEDHGELVGVFTEFSDRLDEMLAYVYENGPEAGPLRQHMRGDHIALSGGAL
jgi:hypothetical protein